MFYFNIDNWFYLQCSGQLNKRPDKIYIIKI